MLYWKIMPSLPVSYAYLDNSGVTGVTFGFWKLLEDVPGAHGKVADYNFQEISQNIAIYFPLYHHECSTISSLLSHPITKQIL